MDSYPQEFIYHHVPLMFVMGLSTIKDLTEQVTLTSPTSPVSPKSVHSRQSSFSSSTSVLTKQQLSKTLLTLLTAKSQNGIWESGKITNQIFHVMTVDKSHQFPPRKPMVRPQQIPPISIPHSSLSPLNPNSPVYPDGLIPPAWVHKHREILPSVFVGFYDLWHKSLDIKLDIKLDVKLDNLLNEKDDPSLVLQEPLGTSEPIEKEKDLNLAMEINEKRKSLYERGIKFAVVILLRPQHLEEQITDDRLAHIRKTSGLEGKNCFFVLSPHADLPDFASNLQKALYEHGLNYYREHGKRVRRKRSRLHSPGVNYIRPSIDHSENVPLSVQGWLARYDYKLATFAEFRQEIDSAINHYESCYNLLIELFVPKSPITPGLQTRSKRWIETRVLADCINLKICKLNLYIDSPSAAMMQLNKHFNTFNKLCNTEGVGESTFEYWAWLSRQYRAFGETLEVATRSGYNIPDPLTITHSTSSDYRSSSSFSNTGVNPSLVLQHPGFYYHLAAKYNSIRGDKFLELEKNLKNFDSEEVFDYPPSAIIEAERHVDHSTLTIELLTKSYEQFKKQKTGRMTFYLASEIAGTYFMARKYDMALKFFERIAKTYRKENWHTILESILRWSLKCAKESAIHNNIMEYYVELLCDRFQMSEEMRVNLQNEFINMMNNNEITSSLHVVIDMNDINSFLNCYVHYKEPETFVGTSTDFQVTFSSPPTTPPFPLKFSFLRFSFNDEYFNHYLTDNEQEILSAHDKLQLIDCKDCKREEREGEGYVWVKDVDLTISKNSTKVFEGSIIPQESGELQLQIVTLGIITANWKIELRFDVNSQREENLKRKWLTLTNNEEQDQQVSKLKFISLKGRREITSINVTQKQAKLDIKVKHQAPALLDEYYPIELTIVNLESDDIKAMFHAEFTSEMHDSEDRIVLDPSHNGTNHLKNINFGIIPANGSLVKTIFVIGKKNTNIRDLNFRIWYAFVSSIPQSLPPSQDWIEKRMEIRLSFITPFSIKFNISPQGERFVQTKKLQKLHHEKVEKYLLEAKISNICPWDINVSTIDLVLFDQANAQTKMEIIASSTDTINESLEQVWKPGHIYNFICLLKLVIMDDKLLDQDIDIGLLDIQWKRNYQSENIVIPFSETTMMVPQIQHPKSDISATIVIPSNPIVGKLLTFIYKIMNGSSSAIKINVTVEVNEAFVFSGYKQTHFYVQPFSTYYFKVNCFPLTSGKVRLPKVKITRIKETDGTEQEIKVTAPGYKESYDDDWYMIFIRPRKELLNELFSI
ncbi:hypothetical protein Glove_132g6 [Diversispora epigaea]|uniref:Trafficking protein particle complex subunit 11 domain-containing protein n=1 Tax=Diversispora epigaea TaxID=1348612 RepID=A0A397J6K7_9GLOM|nr:hypothetical protein Glove_132g6 [Diversispora epigaea]